MPVMAALRHAPQEARWALTDPPTGQTLLQRKSAVSVIEYTFPDARQVKGTIRSGAAHGSMCWLPEAQAAQAYSPVAEHHYQAMAPRVSE